MQTMSEKKKVDHARQQAKAQLESLMALVKELDAADDEARNTKNYDKRDEAEAAIREDAVEVTVRSDWHEPGSEENSTEYKLVLCTGGPAVRLIGDLDTHGQPDSVQMEYQDWGTPWTTYPLSSEEETACLSYAMVFYFGS